MSTVTLKSMKFGNLIRIYPSVNCYNWKYNLFIFLIAGCLQMGVLIQEVQGNIRMASFLILTFGIFLPSFHFGAFLLSSCLFGCCCCKPSCLSITLNSCGYLQIDETGRMTPSVKLAINQISYTEMDTNDGGVPNRELEIDSQSNF